MAEHLTEEQQVEAIKSWWKENGIAIFAGIAIGLAALYGFRYWTDYRAEQAGSASALYEEVQKHLQQKKTGEAITRAQQIISDYSRTPYAALSALMLARLAVDKNEMDEAKTRLQWVLDNSRQTQHEHIARQRLASVLLAEGSHDAALALLSNIKGGGFTGSYAEIRGDIYLAKDDRKAAHDAYDKALQSEGLGAQQRNMLQAKYDDTSSQVSETAEEIAK